MPESSEIVELRAEVATLKSDVAGLTAQIETLQGIIAGAQSAAEAAALEAATRYMHEEALYVPPASPVRGPDVA